MIPDHDQEAVYAAEEEWCVNAWDPVVLDRDIAPDQVAEYMVKALRAAGWTTGDPPEVVFDVPDDGALAGFHRGAFGVNGVIHLHPRLTRPGILLHELAHWVDNRDGHGRRFQANMLSLVDAALGPEEAAALFAEYLEAGLEPEHHHLPDSLK